MECKKLELDNEGVEDHNSSKCEIRREVEVCEKTLPYSTMLFQQNFGESQLKTQDGENKLRHTENNELRGQKNCNLLQRKDGNLQGHTNRKLRKRKKAVKHKHQNRGEKQEQRLFGNHDNDSLKSGHLRQNAQTREKEEISESALTGKAHGIVEELRKKSHLCDKSSSKSGSGISLHNFRHFLDSFKIPKIIKRKSHKTKSDKMNYAHVVSPRRRFCILHKKDKNALRVQLSIWFPCIFRRPVLKAMQEALARLKIYFIRGICRIEIKKLNEHISDAKFQRTLFRKEQRRERSAKTQTSNYASSVIPECQKRVSTFSFGGTTGASTSMDGLCRNTVSALRLMKSEMGGSAKLETHPVFIADRYRQHSLMYHKHVKSNSAVPEIDSGRNYGDCEMTKPLRVDNIKQYHVPDWFLSTIGKEVVIYVHPVCPSQLTGASHEAKKLLEYQTRILLNHFPNSEEFSSLNEHLVLSVREQENMPHYAIYESLTKHNQSVHSVLCKSQPEKQSDSLASIFPASIKLGNSEDGFCIQDSSSEMNTSAIFPYTHRNPPFRNRKLINLNYHNAFSLPLKKKDKSECKVQEQILPISSENLVPKLRNDELLEGSLATKSRRNVLLKEVPLLNTGKDSSLSLDSSESKVIGHNLEEKRINTSLTPLLTARKSQLRDTTTWKNNTRLLSSVHFSPGVSCDANNLSNISMTGPTINNMDTNLNKNIDLQERDICWTKEKHRPDCQYTNESSKTVDFKPLRRRLKQACESKLGVLRKAANSVIGETNIKAAIFEKEKLSACKLTGVTPEKNLRYQIQENEKSSDSHPKKAVKNKYKKVRFREENSSEERTLGIMNKSNSSVHGVQGDNIDAQEIVVDNIRECQEPCSPTSEIHQPVPTILMGITQSNVADRTEATVRKSDETVSSETSHFENIYNDKCASISHFFTDNECSSDSVYTNSRTLKGHLEKDIQLLETERLSNTAKESHVLDCSENYGQDFNGQLFRCTRLRNSSSGKKLPSSSPVTDISKEEWKKTYTALRRRVHRLLPPQSLINFVKEQWRASCINSPACSNCLHPSPKSDNSQTKQIMSEQLILSCGDTGLTSHEPSHKSYSNLYSDNKVFCEKTNDSQQGRRYRSVQKEQSYETMCNERRDNYKKLCSTLAAYCQSLSPENKSKIQDIDNASSTSRRKPKKRLDRKYKSRDGIPSLTQSTSATTQQVTSAELNQRYIQYSLEKKRKGYLGRSKGSSVNMSTTQNKSTESYVPAGKERLIQNTSKTLLTVSENRTASSNTQIKQTQTSPTFVYTPKRCLIPDYISSMLDLSCKETEWLMGNIKQWLSNDSSKPSLFFCVIFALDKLLARYFRSINEQRKLLGSCNDRSTENVGQSKTAWKQGGDMQILNSTAKNKQYLTPQSYQDSFQGSECGFGNMHASNESKSWKEKTCKGTMFELAQNCSVNNGRDSPSQNRSPIDDDSKEPTPRKSLDKAGQETSEKLNPLIQRNGAIGGMNIDKSSAGSNHQSLAGDISPPLARKVSKSSAGSFNIRKPPAGNISMSPAGNISHTSPGKTDKRSSGSISKSPTGNSYQSPERNNIKRVDGTTPKSQPSDISHSPAWNISMSPPEDIIKSPTLNISKSPLGNIALSSNQSLKPKSRDNIHVNEELIEPSSVRECNTVLPNVPSRISPASRYATRQQLPTHKYAPVPGQTSKDSFKREIAADVALKQSSGPQNKTNIYNYVSVNRPLLDNCECVIPSTKTAFQKQVSHEIHTEKEKQKMLHACPCMPTSHENHDCEFITNSKKNQELLESCRSILNCTQLFAATLPPHLPERTEFANKPKFSYTLDSLPGATNVGINQTMATGQSSDRPFFFSNRPPVLAVCQEQDKENRMQQPVPCQLSPAQIWFRDICDKVKTNHKVTDSTNQQPRGSIADSECDTKARNDCQACVTSTRRTVDECLLKKCDILSSLDVPLSPRSHHVNLCSKLEVDNRLLDPSKNYNDLGLLEDSHKQDMTMRKSSAALKERICSKLNRLRNYCAETKDPNSDQIWADCQSMKPTEHFSRPDMSTKCLQVEIHHSREHCSESPKTCVSVFIQTCACISKPNGTCMCGYLSTSEKFVPKKKQFHLRSNDIIDARPQFSLKNVCIQTSDSIKCEQETNDCPALNDDTGRKFQCITERVRSKPSSPCQTKYRNKKCQVTDKRPGNHVFTSIGASLSNDSPYQTRSPPLRQQSAGKAPTEIKRVQDNMDLLHGNNWPSLDEDKIICSQCKQRLDNVKATQGEIHNLYPQGVAHLSHTNQDKACQCQDFANCVINNPSPRAACSSIHQCSVCAPKRHSDQLPEVNNTCKSDQESSLILAEFFPELSKEEWIHMKEKQPIIHIRYRSRHGESSPQHHIYGSKTKSLSLQLKEQISGLIENSRLLQQQAVQLKNKCSCLDEQQWLPISQNRNDATSVCRCCKENQMPCYQNDKNYTKFRDKNTNANQSADQLSEEENVFECLNKPCSRTIKTENSVCPHVLGMPPGGQHQRDSEMKFKPLVTESNQRYKMTMNKCFSPKGSVLYSSSNQESIPGNDSTQGNEHVSPCDFFQQCMDHKDTVCSDECLFIKEDKNRSWNARPPTAEDSNEKMNCRVHEFTSPQNEKMNCRVHGYTSPQNEKYFVNDPSEEAYQYVNAHFPIISRSPRRPRFQEDIDVNFDTRTLHHSCSKVMFKNDDFPDKQQRGTQSGLSCRMCRRRINAVTSSTEPCSGGHDLRAANLSRAFHLPACARFENVDNGLGSHNVERNDTEVACTLREAWTDMTTCTAENVCRDISPELSDGKTESQDVPRGLILQEDKCLPSNSALLPGSVSLLTDNYWQMAYKIGSLTQAKLPGTQAKLPGTQAKPPVTQAKLPVTQATLPVTQATLPVTQAKLPVTQATLPVTQASVNAIKELVLTSHKNNKDNIREATTIKEDSGAISSIRHSRKGTRSVGTMVSFKSGQHPLRGNVEDKSIFSSSDKDSNPTRSCNSSSVSKYFAKYMQTSGALEKNMRNNHYNNTAMTALPLQAENKKSNYMCRNPNSFRTFHSPAPQSNYLQLQDRLRQVAGSNLDKCSSNTSQISIDIELNSVSKVNVPTHESLTVAPEDRAAAQKCQAGIVASCDEETKHFSQTSTDKSAGVKSNSLQNQTGRKLQTRKKRDNTENFTSFNIVDLECESLCERNHAPLEKTKYRVLPELKRTSRRAHSAVDSQDSSHGIEDLPLDSLSTVSEQLKHEPKQNNHTSSKTMSNRKPGIEYTNNVPSRRRVLFSRPLPLLTYDRSSSTRPETKVNPSGSNDEDSTFLRCGNAFSIEKDLLSTKNIVQTKELTHFTPGTECKQFEVSMSCTEDTEDVPATPGEFGDESVLWNSAAFVKEKSYLKNIPRRHTVTSKSVPSNFFDKADSLVNSKRHMSNCSSCSALDHHELGYPETGPDTAVSYSYLESMTLLDNSDKVTLSSDQTPQSNLLTSKETPTDISSHWRTCLLGCGEVIVVNDDMVIIEGAFIIKSSSPRKLDVLKNSQTSISDIEGQPSEWKHGKAVPFRLIMSRHKSQGEPTRVTGTYSRQLLTSDTFFNWKFAVDRLC